MSPTPPTKPEVKRKGPKLTSAQAQARLSDALRENLRRRKAQVRARESGSEEGREADHNPDKSGGETG